MLRSMAIRAATRVINKPIEEGSILYCGWAVPVTIDEIRKKRVQTHIVLQ
jgi:hypothetical protein